MNSRTLRPLLSLLARDIQLFKRCQSCGDSFLTNASSGDSRENRTPEENAQHCPSDLGKELEIPDVDTLNPQGYPPSIGVRTETGDEMEMPRERRKQSICLPTVFVPSELQSAIDVVLSSKSDTLQLHLSNSISCACVHVCIVTSGRGKGNLF